MNPEATAGSRSISDFEQVDRVHKTENMHKKTSKLCTSEKATEFSSVSPNRANVRTAQKTPAYLPASQPACRIYFDPSFLHHTTGGKVPQKEATGQNDKGGGAT